MNLHSPTSIVHATAICLAHMLLNAGHVKFQNLMKRYMDVTKKSTEKSISSSTGPRILGQARWYTVPISILYFIFYDSTCFTPLINELNMMKNFKFTKTEEEIMERLSAYTVSVTNRDIYSLYLQNKITGQILALGIAWWAVNFTQYVQNSQFHRHLSVLVPN